MRWIRHLRRTPKDAAGVMVGPVCQVEALEGRRMLSVTVSSGVTPPTQVVVPPVNIVGTFAGNMRVAAGTTAGFGAQSSLAGIGGTVGMVLQIISEDVSGAVTGTLVVASNPSTIFDVTGTVTPNNASLFFSGNGTQGSISAHIRQQGVVLRGPVTSTSGVGAVAGRTRLMLQNSVVVHQLNGTGLTTPITTDPESSIFGTAPAIPTGFAAPIGSISSGPVSAVPGFAAPIGSTSSGPVSAVPGFAAPIGSMSAGPTTPGSATGAVFSTGPTIGSGLTVSFSGGSL